MSTFIFRFSGVMQRLHERYCYIGAWSAQAGYKRSAFTRLVFELPWLPRNIGNRQRSNQHIDLFRNFRKPTAPITFPFAALRIISLPAISLSSEKPIFKLTIMPISLQSNPARKYALPLFTNSISQRSYSSCFSFRKSRIYQHYRLLD